MNLLFLAEDERGKGYGTQLIQFWEEEMRRQQHLERRPPPNRTSRHSSSTGSMDMWTVGPCCLPGEPLEILLSKRLPG